MRQPARKIAADASAPDKKSSIPSPTRKAKTCSGLTKTVTKTEAIDPGVTEPDKSECVSSISPGSVQCLHLSGKTVALAGQGLYKTGLFRVVTRTRRSSATRVSTVRVPVGYSQPRPFPAGGRG